ncbi:uracil permease-like protein [Cladochytrium replicatum]|nr:uracil permease-like protein [Cladochytrium replicatum]
MKFKLEVDHPPGLSAPELMLQNDDLKPVEPSRRTWRAYNFVGFWISDGFNLTTWTIASAFLVAGLSAWDAWATVWIGYVFTGVMVALGGRVGAVHHIGFPVAARASFGIYGALWPVLNRAMMACVWYGVQSWIGGTCITQMIRSIVPSYYDIPNTMPESTGITTRDFVSFIIFWTISLPAIYFPVEQIRHLFTLKMILTPIGAIIFFVWSIVRAGGIGPILSQPATISGSEWTWVFVAGIFANVANFATLIVNDADFTRFADKPSSALLPQVITIPMTFVIVSFVGIVVSSSSTVIYKETIWSPLDLLGRLLDGEPSGAVRFGVFFISLCFVLAQIGVNIAANSVSAGSDMTALLPRYVSLRRGGFICAVVGLVMCPWNLLSSSNRFTTYLGAYSVFLSAISGVLMCDYYVIRRGSLKVAELYSTKKTGDYWYNYGISWKAYVAYFAGILVNIVGFVGAVTSPISETASQMYNFAYIIGFGVSAIIYYVLWRIWPSPGMMPSGWHEKDEYVFAAVEEEVKVDEA